jgi:hypothetical protein
MGATRLSAFSFQAAHRNKMWRIKLRLIGRGRRGNVIEFKRMAWGAGHRSKQADGGCLVYGLVSNLATIKYSESVDPIGSGKMLPLMILETESICLSSRLVSLRETLLA